MPHFLFPAFFGAAWAVSVPILLHLLRKRRRRPQPLPSLFFLTAAVESTQSSAWRRRLILLSRCLAVLTLAAAFARPYYVFHKTPGTATVVVVDQSFSLQALDRWSELHKWARQQIGDEETGDKLGLVAMATRAHWIEPLSTDTAAVKNSFDQMAPGWETARVEPALRLAADALEATSAHEKRIIVMTDHQQVAWAGTDFAKKMPAGVKLIFAEPARAPKSQVALSNPIVERNSLPPSPWQASVKVTSFSTSSQSRTLKLFVENESRPRAEIALKLAPHEVRVQPIAVESSTGARWIRFTLDPDDLPVDDTAYALVPKMGETSATIFIDAPPGSGAVDYPSTGLMSVTQITPTFQLAPLPLRSEWPRRAGILLRNASSFTGETGQRLDAFLNHGGEALVFLDSAVAASPWWQTHGIALAPLPHQTDAWKIHDWTVEHPIVSPFSEYGLRNLLGWSFRGGWSLPKGRAEPIGFWSDGSIAIGELSVGAGSVLVCGFSPDRTDGDWVIDEAFVPFLHRAMAQIVNATQPIARAHHWVGEPIALPPGVGQWRRLSGPGSEKPATSIENQIVPSQPGIYSFERRGETSLYSIELSPEESDLSPWPNGLPWWELQSLGSPQTRAAQIAAPDVSAVDSEAKDGRWWWCILFLGTFFLIELLLANRTTR